MKRTLAAAAVALAAFALYDTTLLPGLDFGDAASFEATVGTPIIPARKAYPLYFAIGDAWIRVTGLEPAPALNLASAIAGALACGVSALVAAELSGSALAGAGAALLFGVSYTFWSQAITAEVYGLHLLFLAATLWLLLRWQEAPTLTRLSAFFAVFALGFGNHLSMILLLPAYTLFLLLASPRGWRSLVEPRVVAIAALCALAGALQYAAQFRALWLSPEPPASLAQGFAMFWFDVTKTDWRDTLVGTLPREMLADHAAMYWFDLRQQFGSVVPALACAGFVHLVTTDVRRAALLALVWAVNVVFAFTYNVGDSHVFYLPSHAIVALLTAPGIAFAARLVKKHAAGAQAAAALLLLGYASYRAYRDFPALDRSRDTRATAILEALTRGVDDRHAILLADMNWQIQNGLAYYARTIRPEIAYEAPDAVLPDAPALVAANRAIGRDVIVTAEAGALLTGRYGATLTATPDASAAAEPLSRQVAGLGPGTRYVLCVLRPTRDLSLDAGDLARATATLAGRPIALPAHDYVAIAGIVGEPPQILESADRPFATRASIASAAVEIRMGSWLAADTIRRMGFGHVIVNRVHTLIVERGVSFVAFDEAGQPIRTAYASNIFAPQPRYLIGIAGR